MSEAEDPERLAADHAVTVDDVRELMGGSTPHFALQIRDRLRRLIERLPVDDPARIEGELGIARLERMALAGQSEGPVQEHELALPSLELEDAEDA